MKTIAFTLLLVVSACTPTSTKTETEKTPPTNPQNQIIVQQLFEYFNKHQWKEMAALYTAKAEFKDPSLGTKPVIQTQAETIEKYKALEGVFADIHDQVIAIYPSGEKHVIVEFVSTGTAPDSTTFELPICSIFTIENGKIVKDYTYYDNSNH